MVADARSPKPCVSWVDVMEHKCIVVYWPRQKRWAWCLLVGLVNKVFRDTGDIIWRDYAYMVLAELKEEFLYGNE